MANVIIKSDERRIHEAYVRHSFGVRDGDTAGREAAEVIAARSREAVEAGRKKGERRLW